MDFKNVENISVKMKKNEILLRDVFIFGYEKIENYE